MQNEEEDWFSNDSTFGGNTPENGRLDTSGENTTSKSDTGVVHEIDSGEEFDTGLENQAKKTPAGSEASSEENSNLDVGDALLAKGIITTADLDTARKVLAQSPGKKLYDVLYDSCDDEIGLQEVVAEYYGMSFRRVCLDDIQLDFVRSLGIDYCTDNSVLPIAMSGSRLIAWCSTPR